MKASLICLLTLSLTGSTGRAQDSCPAHATTCPAPSPVDPQPSDASSTQATREQIQQQIQAHGQHHLNSRELPATNQSAPVKPPPPRSEFLTNEEFDVELSAVRERLAGEHEAGASRIRERMSKVHEEFHDSNHRAKTIRGQVPPQGGVLVSRDEMALLEQTADAKAKVFQTARHVKLGLATPADLVKAQARFEERMNAFMGGDKPSLLHDAYHKSYAGDPEGDNGLGGASSGYQGDHNRRMRESDPTNPFPLVFSGNAELAEGNAAAAKAFANQALALDAKYADALSLRAAAQMELKDYKAAAQDAKEALALDPSDERSRAVVMLAHDRVADGFSVKNAAAGRPQAADTSVFGFGLSPAGNIVSAQGAALQSAALVRQIERAIAMGDNEAAIAQAARAIRLDPSNGNAFAFRAMARLREGDHEEALKDALAALRLDPQNALAANLKASALNRMGKHRDALAAADAAIAANPKNAYAYYMKAMALDGLNDRQAMLAALSKAAALDPRYEHALELARQAPDDQDLAFLFPEEQLAAAKAALSTPVRRGRGRVSLIAAVAGAGLILFGLSHLILGGLAKAYSRLARTGPTLGKSASAALSLPMGEASLLRGQFRPLKELGSGPRGTVFEGLDVSLDRRVAIRRLAAPLRADDRQRLLAPARQAALLSHPAIAGLYSIIEQAEEFYLIVELAQGRTLKDLLTHSGPMPAAKALAILRGFAEALDYAHARGVSHGAMRLTNLVVGPDGQPKIVDFGLSTHGKGKSADLADFADCVRAMLGLAALPLAARALSATALIDAVINPKTSINP